MRRGARTPRYAGRTAAEGRNDAGRTRETFGGLGELFARSWSHPGRMTVASSAKATGNRGTVFETRVGRTRFSLHGRRCGGVRLPLAAVFAALGPPRRSFHDLHRVAEELPRHIAGPRDRGMDRSAADGHRKPGG